MIDWMTVSMKTICRSSFTVLVISLLSHQAHAMNSVWKTTTSFDSEKSRAILSWSFNTTEAVTSVTIRKGKEVIASSLLTSTATPNYKYQVVKTQTTREIKITLTVYNITSADYGVYRCSLDQLDVHKDIHLTITVPVWVDPSSKVTARSGEDATFTWQYKYSFQSSFITVTQRRDTPTIEVLGYWEGNKFQRDGNYTDMERLNKTSTGDGEIIQLKLLKTTEDKYGCVYECDIIFEDGEEIKSEIKLEKLIDISTKQHYSLTTQNNSKPTAEIPDKARTINTVVVCVGISLLVVGFILGGVVVYRRRKGLCKYGGYSSVSGLNGDEITKKPDSNLQC